MSLDNGSRLAAKRKALFLEGSAMSQGASARDAVQEQIVAAVATSPYPNACSAFLPGLDSPSPTKRPRLVGAESDELESYFSNDKSKAATSIGGDEDTVELHTMTSPSPLESLPLKVLREILLFVGDSPRQLFTLATNIKAFHSAIQSRPDIVVHAAVFHSKRTAMHMKTIVDCIQKRQIYIPTTMRLLRLLNTVYCERGDKCCGYNLETKLPERLKGSVKNRMSIYQVIRVCDECFDTLRCDAVDCRDSYLGDLPSIRLEPSHQVRVLRETFVEHATNELVGSIILGKHLVQLRKTHLPNGYLSCDSEKEAFTNALKALHQNLSQTNRNDSDRAALICESYEKYFFVAKCRRLEEEDRKEKNRQIRVEKRIAKAKLRVDDFKIAFGEITRSYPFLFECSFDCDGTGKFEAAFVDEILGTAIRNTSKKITKAKLGEMIESVIDIVILLEQRSFLGKERLNFLDEDDIVQAALLTYFRNLEPVALLTLWSEDRDSFPSFNTVGSTFAGLISDDRQLDALILLFDRYHRRFSKRRVALRLSSMDFFCVTVVEEFGVPCSKNWRNRYMNLAKRIYGREELRYSPSRDGWYERFEARYLHKRSKFKEFLSLIRSYRKWPRTIAFLREAKPNGNFTARDAVYSIYKNMTYSEKQMLLNREFDALLSHHQEMLKSGSLGSRYPYS